MGICPVGICPVGICPGVFVLESSFRRLERIIEAKSGHIKT